MICLIDERVSAQLANSNTASRYFAGLCNFLDTKPNASSANVEVFLAASALKF
jgi:hypothetical protein